MPGQKQHPKLPNSCYLNRRDFSERVFGNLTYLWLLWPCQSQVWEACVTGRPAGGPGAAGCTLRTSKRSWHGSCAGRGDTCPPRYWRRKTKCEGDTDARCCWTDAGDEEWSTWQESPGGAQDVVANPSPVKLNSLSASRGFWSSPPLRPHTQNVCIHLSTCFGGSRRRLLLFCHICFPFFFSSFQRCGLTAVTGVNRHGPCHVARTQSSSPWPSAGAQGTSLAEFLSVKDIRSGILQRLAKGISLHGRSGSVTVQGLKKNLDRSQTKGTALVISYCYRGEKQPESLALNYYFKGLPYNLTYDGMKSKM